ncbi:hypothetical protein LguiA_004239 [Lonicera macranthoides]
MLLAVEGGGFFSSSASGYSKGLTLLLLGQKNVEEKPMRVSPWNHYQLVDQESDSDLQLASSGKNQLSRRCASFVCFGRSTTGPESPSAQKVGPTTTQQQDRPVPDQGKDGICTNDIVNANDNIKEIPIPLKSNLKKPITCISVPCRTGNEHEEKCDVDGHTQRRKVQWMDVSGGELVDIREFEPSEDGMSDDEFDSANEKTCVCRIM